MDIARLNEQLPGWRKSMEEARNPPPEEWTWYGYDILSNIAALNALCSEDSRAALRELGQCRIADIGCADGDLGYLLAEQGHPVDLIDWPATNWNGLRGARLLNERLNAATEIHEIDLDDQFRLPEDRYGFVFLLGILYHLKNPFYILEAIAKRTRYCAISTRVVRWANAVGSNKEVEIGGIPVAYLVDPQECNNDRTNYWMFTLAGLERIVDRSGWEILDSQTWGEENSHPADTSRDQRAYMLLKSRLYSQ